MSYQKVLVGVASYQDVSTTSKTADRHKQLAKSIKMLPSLDKFNELHKWIDVLLLVLPR